MDKQELAKWLYEWRHGDVHINCSVPYMKFLDMRIREAYQELFPNKPQDIPTYQKVYEFEKLGYAFQTEKEWKDYRKSELEKEGKECLWD